MKPPNASKETLEAFWGLAELDKKTRLESSLTILKDVNNHQSTQNQVRICFQHQKKLNSCGEVAGVPLPHFSAIIFKSHHPEIKESL